MTNAKHFITEHLDLWTSATEKKSSAGRGNGGRISFYGIQKLRELVLQLAVRGRLVPQPKDGGHGPTPPRKSAGKKTTHPDERPLDFVPPSNWTATKFGDFFHLEYGNNLPKQKRTESGEFPVFGSNGIVGTHNEACVFAPCIVVGRKGSAGALNLCAEQSCWVTDVAYSCVPPQSISLEYTLVLFTTLGLDELGKGIKPGLSRNEAYALPVAIPPTTEQHRIVAKVNELMGLCDALEAQTENSLEAHQTLVETCLATLTNSQSLEDLAQSWNRIEEHFDTLFTTEESIGALETSIYELAIRGALVPQDPNDEPAVAFLTREAGIRSSESENLPSGWTAVSLGELGTITGGGTPTKSNEDFWNGEIPWVSPKDMKVDFINDATDKITEKAVSNSSVKMIQSGSLLFVVRGMILAHSFPVAITNVPVTINQDMKAIDLWSLDRDYVLIVMKGLKREVLSRVERSSHGTCKLVSNKLWSIELPIPPFAEQSRIAEQVSKLLDICSNLRARVRTEATTSALLANALTSQIH